MPAHTSEPTLNTLSITLEEHIEQHVLRAGTDHNTTLCVWWPIRLESSTDQRYTMIIDYSSRKWTRSQQRWFTIFWCDECCRYPRHSCAHRRFAGACAPSVTSLHQFILRQAGGTQPTRLPMDRRNGTSSRLHLHSSHSKQVKISLAYLCVFKWVYKMFMVWSLCCSDWACKVFSKKSYNSQFFRQCSTIEVVFKFVLVCECASSTSRFASTCYNAQCTRDCGHAGVDRLPSIAMAYEFHESAN